MSKRTVLLAALGAFALISALAAVPVQADHHETTIVGCLNAGDEEGAFVLTPEEGDPVAVTGGEDIAGHADNHKVELTGAWVEHDDGSKEFAATGVQHLGICE